VLTNRQDTSDGPTRLHPTTGDSKPPRSRRALFGSAIYHPTSVFRVLLNRTARGQKSTASALSECPPPPVIPVRAPRLLTFLGVALLVSVASGFLELAALAIKAQVQQRVGWHSLMTSRHITWMVPVTAPLVIVPLAMILAGPVFALSAWRRRRGREASPQALARAWGWAGTVLGMLVFLGPLLAARLLHPAAAVALALGLGFRLWHGLVRPIAGWRRLSFAGACVVILALPACLYAGWNSIARKTEPNLFRPVAESPNLLWIVLDTLSASHMSMYGYSRHTTPELESWANRGINFEMARSAAPWTLPSHVTMFTGLWPFEHGARVDRAYSRPFPTLAEHLRAQGYRTAGVVANVRMCNIAYGVGRGFDYYVDELGNQEISLRAMLYNSALGSEVMRLCQGIGLPVVRPAPFGLERTAPEITAEGRAWLDKPVQGNSSETTGSRRPFFLFLNLMDMHGPYMPSPEAVGRFWTGSPITSKALATPACGWNALRVLAAAQPEQREERQRELDDVRRRLTDLYDECLYGLDAELGRFLSELRAEGRLANTWVVITADHGEHFGEHGRFGHGSSLYNEQTHVPLILIPPLGPEGTGAEGGAQPRGRRVTAPVSLRDLPRTLTELLIPGSHNPFPGRSLARTWSASGPILADPVLSQLEAPQLAGDDFATDQSVTMNSMIDENYTLIDFGGSPPELYSIDDRKQQRNLAGDPEQRSRLDRLRSTLATLRNAPGRQ
jgi:arylsulfatase A-like enzyme